MSFVEDNFNDLGNLSDQPDTLDMTQLLQNFEHNEPIFDNELLYPSPKESEIVHYKDEHLIQGTVEAIVAYITSPNIIDYQSLVDFFLTFRSYIDSLPLLELLLCRLSWCLKRSLSNDDNTSIIGQSVLVRTFVTLRHWLLNHFQDDFVKNVLLRQLFTGTLNEMAKYDEYIGLSSNTLQAKIVRDLKKVYSSLCHLYWNIKIDKDINSTDDMLFYQLNAYENMPISRLSLHGSKQLNDPSFRRSGLLSMMDNQSLTSNQLLSNNYNNKSNLTQLEGIINERGIKKHHPKTVKCETDFRNFKASMSNLRQKPVENSARNSLDLIYSSLLEDMNSESLKGVVDLSQNKSDSNKGFTINGKVEIFNDSNVDKIYSLKYKETKSENQNNILKEQIKEQPDKFSSIIVKKSALDTSKNQKKKNFFKSFFGSDKENEIMVSHKTVKNSNTRMKLGNSNINTNLKLNQGEKSKYNTIPTPQSIIEDLEKLVDTTNKVDYLSNRLLDDYNKVIENPRFRRRLSKQLYNANRKSVLSTALNFQDVKEEEDINHITPTKVTDNNRNSEANISFQAPSPIGNWSESDILDTSNEFVDMNVNDSAVNNSVILRNSLCQDENSPNFLPDKKDSPPRTLIKDDNDDSLVHTPGSLFSESPFETPQNLNPKQVNVNGWSVDNHVTTDTFTISSRAASAVIAQPNMRLSVLSKKESRLSAKSYLSYDSAFSNSFASTHKKSPDALNNLRRQNGFANLRLDNNASLSNDEDFRTGFGNASFESYHNDTNINNVNENSSCLENNLALLSELPYNTILNFDSVSTLSIISSPAGSHGPNYNGISQTAINELAAIPDQTLDGNPLDWTLNKLRGQAAVTPMTAPSATFDLPDSIRTNQTSEPNTPKVVYGLNDEKSITKDTVVRELKTSSHSPFMSPSKEMHKKHAIAIVCKSPTKQDNVFIDLDENNEVSLEKQVRDLYISNNPNDENEKNSNNRLSVSTRLTSSSKLLQMNLLSRSGSVLTRTSTGKLLRDTPDQQSNFELNSLWATPKGLNVNEQKMSVEQVLKENKHIPFIFEIDTQILMEQLTLIEKDILMEIEWSELVNLKWDQPIVPYNSWLRLLLDSSLKSGLQMVTLRFNLMTNWVISQILLCSDVTLRVLTISRFIYLAVLCREAQNYSTVFEIMLALNSDMIKKLKSTWIRVDPGSILKLKNLNDLTSPIGNFKNYREELGNIVVSKGMIPFLPLALSDLTTNSELPNIINSSAVDSDLESTSLNIENNDNFYELVNFEKFRKGGNIMKNTIRMIEWSKFYNYKVDKDILSKCLYVSCLSEEEMDQCIEII
ncbi:mitotic regulator [Martiniozyma asiatica (nom. inval.)]|nr:mitotic regulator [Martiniozyma asiatica]